MASCEKCWNDAGGNTDKYQRLIKERVTNPCTPEEQAGTAAKLCPKCKSKTIHQFTNQCVKCGYSER